MISSIGLADCILLYLGIQYVMMKGTLGQVNWLVPPFSE
jgi:hypothetical protein